MNIRYHTETLQIEFTFAILQGPWDRHYLSFLYVYYFWCSLSTSNILKMEKQIVQLESEGLVQNKKENSEVIRNNKKESNIYLFSLKSKSRRDFLKYGQFFRLWRQLRQSSCAHIGTCRFFKTLGHMCLFCLPGWIGIPYA